MIFIKRVKYDGDIFVGNLFTELYDGGEGFLNQLAETSEIVCECSKRINTVDMALIQIYLRCLIFI
jgi:hypothetical protein